MVNVGLLGKIAWKKLHTFEFSVFVRLFGLLVLTWLTWLSDEIRQLVQVSIFSRIRLVSTLSVADATGHFFVSPMVVGAHKYLGTQAEKI